MREQKWAWQVKIFAMRLCAQILSPTMKTYMNSCWSTGVASYASKSSVYQKMPQSLLAEFSGRFLLKSYRRPLLNFESCPQSLPMVIAEIKVGDAHNPGICMAAAVILKETGKWCAITFVPYFTCQQTGYTGMHNKGSLSIEIWCWLSCHITTYY